ncbi:MAG TPA: 3-carboxy-cis,cis-muconate cycloisomerase [Acidimicrobiia bacterium]|jgi:3-carboxy-cis,cis-muconate cycloisomerase|nr:3-carboxy-cis,cis-muconate cycloisomerase [Acidimicrobiia bacterium]
MRPSSSSSDPAENGASGLFDAVNGRGAVPGLVSDSAYLQAMLDVEAALARAEAQTGLIPIEHEEAIAAACQAGRFDVSELGRAAAAAGNPVVPLVEQLRDAVGGEAAASVHAGATSQDIIDTATMLVARGALTAIAADLDAAGDAAAGLATEHAQTVMAGRTLLQQALPTTFGAKAAGWVSGIDDAADLLDSVRHRRLAVQLGGGAGTLAALHPHGPEVVRLLAEELGLTAPAMPWHTNRSRISELAGALGVTAGALAKPARDVTLLAQTEIGEVREGVPGRGGSSAMPHKRNPVAAVATLANTTQAPGLVATLLTATSGHDHERAAGAWHAEWHPLRELFIAVGSAAAWLADCLTHLEVDPGRMRANIGPDVEKYLDPPDYLASTADIIAAALQRHTTRRETSA